MSEGDALCSFPTGLDSWKLAGPRHFWEEHKMLEFGLGWETVLL